MGNKSIGTAHEKRTAKWWIEKLGFKDVFVARDNKHMHDLRGGPFPIECKKRKRWEPQRWAREMEAAHGKEWMVHLEVRDMRPKDAPPKVLMMSEEALLRLKAEWELGETLTPQEWVKYGVANGYMEMNV